MKLEAVAKRPPPDPFSGRHCYRHRHRRLPPPFPLPQAHHRLHHLAPTKPLLIDLQNSSKDQSSFLPKETTPKPASLESPEDSSFSSPLLDPHQDPALHTHSDLSPALSPPRKHHRRSKKFFTELNGIISITAKNHQNDISEDCDVEALIAISVGFPVDSLTMEEIEANVISAIDDSKQANYIVVGNHILTLWLSNVDA